MTNGEPACDMSALFYFYIYNYNRLFLLIWANWNFYEKRKFSFIYETKNAEKC